VRAEIVDSAGNLCREASHNITFSIESGPGRIVGVHSGNPQSHEHNQKPFHTAYHGLARGVIMVTKDASSPLWHRRRLAEMERDNAISKIVAAGDENGDTAIMLSVSAPGLTGDSLSIPVSTDAATHSVLAAATEYGAQPVLGFD
jgi:hypothetical protein